MNIGTIRGPATCLKKDDLIYGNHIHIQHYGFQKDDD